MEKFGILLLGIDQMIGELAFQRALESLEVVK